MTHAAVQRPIGIARQTLRVWRVLPAADSGKQPHAIAVPQGRGFHGMCAIYENNRHLSGGNAERAYQVAHRTRIGKLRMSARRSMLRKRGKASDLNGRHREYPKDSQVAARS